MHYTVTLDVISKIHVHVLLMHQNHSSELCQVILSFCSALYERMRPETLALLSQSDQEGAKQHIHFCYNEA